MNSTASVHVRLFVAGYFLYMIQIQLSIVMRAYLFQPEQNNFACKIAV